VIDDWHKGHLRQTLRDANLVPGHGPGRLVPAARERTVIAHPTARGTGIDPEAAAISGRPVKPSAGDRIGDMVSDVVIPV
jgi:glyoxylase-like metal-dependent hydrolase (beta-lactamase superfamily II)